MTNEVSAARTGLHAVAEHLLAGPQYRTSGTIRLAVTEDGFSTVRSPADGVDALLVRADGVLRRPGGLLVPLTGSFAALASALGVQPGAPSGVYPASTPEPPEELVLPRAGVDVVLQALIVGDQALRSLTAQSHPGLEPVLWPEHFDVALTLDEVNFGVSPGDAEHPLPYAYVGPWSPPARGGFWNEPFGAGRALADLGGVAEVVDYFREGRSRAAL